jgi:DNA adenine methylase
MKKTKPFMKWAGGKRQILNILVENMPKKYNRYYEPFIGGGALFFYIMPDNAYISDINPELINLYEVVRDNFEGLINDLKKHKNDEDYYYKLRNVDRTKAYTKWSKVRKASRTIYLNKTCFNGLYRMNSKGQFNVPFGFYKNPKIVDGYNLKACSLLLQNTEIVLGSFLEIENRVKEGDFVYFDPPYVPINQTSSFTKYYKDDFDYDMQFELKELCDRISKKKVNFMLSNSYTEFVEKLYKKSYDFKKIKAIRAINCKGNKRGKINEVIIKNY